MNNLVLGCADSLIAHQVYADFLEDQDKDTSFFRIFLQMRRSAYCNFEVGWDDYEYFEDVFYKRGIGNSFANGGNGWGDGENYGNLVGGGGFYE